LRDRRIDMLCGVIAWLNMLRVSEIGVGLASETREQVEDRRK
jgi:hypothetical protein